MGIFSKTEIKDITKSVVTVGNHNLIRWSEQITLLGESRHDKIDWDKIVQSIGDLQQEVRALPDEFEQIRDEVLVPKLAVAKREAGELKQDPERPKKGFLEKMKDILDISSKAGEVGVKLAPAFTGVMHLLGISI